MAERQREREREGVINHSSQAFTHFGSGHCPVTAGTCDEP